MASLGYPEILLAFIFFLVLGGLSSKDAVPWNFPVIGMIPSLLLHLHHIHERAAKILEQTGLTFLFKGPWFCNMNILATIDPADVNYIMTTNFSNFPKGHEFKKIFDVLGDGIFNADWDSWKNQRKVAQALINNRGFDRFLRKTWRDKVEEGLVPVLDHLSEHGLTVDLQELFQRLTFDTISTTVTGFDPKCLSIEFPEVPFMKAFNDIEKALFLRHVVPESLWRVQMWLGFGGEKKLKEGREILDHILHEIISRKQEAVSKRTTRVDEEEGVDLLTSYLTEEEKEGPKHDEKFMRDTVMNLLIAGLDGISLTLSWFFWLISENPSVESKIRDEIKSVITENEDEDQHQQWKVFTSEALTKLVYLHAALCETLRLYPAVPFQHKSPVQPDTLPSGHKVDPKMKILVFSYAMGRMKAIWGDDCLQFRPERWISARGEIKHEPSYKFFAFNAGPRTCIGKNVSFSQMKAVAAAMIHNYNFEVVEGQHVAPGLSIVLCMKHGLMVRVKKRWH